MHERAGSSGKVFPNGVRDATRNGELLADFVDAKEARTAELSEAHVVALRLYTTAAYKSINGPLRDRTRTTTHPLAATVTFLTDAINRLRAVSADGNSGSLDLWRGMRNVTTSAAFEHDGGSEYAPMSTTSEAAVAVAYGASSCSLLFKVATSSFMDRGADLTWCSAFPSESEFLFPPLTYLQPTGRREVVDVRVVGATHQFTVIEVAPHFPS
jgi:hypothetical protein